MIKPDKWTVEQLLTHYYHKISQIVSDYQKDNNYSDFSDKLSSANTLYMQAFNLIYENEKLNFAYFVPADDFIQEAKKGSFNDYDGCGYWIDWSGNEITYVNFASIKKKPEGAVFVTWYNK